MDSIEIIYYNLEDEKYERINKYGQKKKDIRKGGSFVDFRLNGKSLKEIIEENSVKHYFDNSIFNLGATIFFDNLNYVYPKIQLIRLMGNKVEERDILEIFNNYNNLGYSLNEIREIANQEAENANEVYLTVCRLCGGYGCGVESILIRKKSDKIVWDFTQFYGDIEDEEFQYEYEFDSIEYIYELYSFEKHFSQLLKAKNKNSK